MEQEFRNLFAARGVFVEVKILPAVLEMGAQTARRDEPTEYEAVTDQMLEQRSIPTDTLMCYSGRQKSVGRVTLEGLRVTGAVFGQPSAWRLPVIPLSDVLRYADFSTRGPANASSIGVWNKWLE